MLLHKDESKTAAQRVAQHQRMCRIGRAAGAAAEVPAVHRSLFGHVDRSKRGDAYCHARASAAGNRVSHLSHSAARALHGNADSPCPSLSCQNHGHNRVQWGSCGGCPCLAATWAEEHETLSPRRKSPNNPRTLRFCKKNGGTHAQLLLEGS
jgi:hypothetical protein